MTSIGGPLAQTPPPIVLLGWDFSETAPQVLTWAADYARYIGGRLVLVHVLEIPPSAEIPFPGTSKEEIDRIKASMEQAAARHGVDALVEVVMSHSASKALIDAATYHGASMLCVGRNRTGLRRLLLGSVANQVARNSPIPVLIVPPSAG